MIHHVLLDGTHMVEIESHKHGTQYVLLDADIYEKLKGVTMHVFEHGVLRKYFYVRFRYMGEAMQLHRFVMGNPKGKSVDHVDTKDHLDNRRSNLRIGTQRQNAANALKRNQEATSVYKGVYYGNGKWIARITVDYKGISLGSYNSEVEAAITYNLAAKNYFGEFALLNEIPIAHLSIIPQKTTKNVSVIQMSMDGETIRIWGSITEAVNAFGFQSSLINKCCNGKRNHHGKFKWKYA